ncbi:MAG: S-formylglutathione hydrolase [Rhodospirillaceae bacterium]|nr:S-formylglutathione hydrolase [Rhodospirillaceae bacterium]
MSLEQIKSAACFGGRQTVWRHRSRATGTDMEFSVFLPPQAAEGVRLPVVTYLSGLTCTWANVTEKGQFQGPAAKAGLIVVCPDTSPRGLDLPGEHDAYDFGSGAGFYIDATEPPWSAHYRMQTYVADELADLVAANFPVDTDRQGIFGHSMGGHGALTLAFKHPDRYRSLSAFSPIVAPSQVPWGKKAFTGYLGTDAAGWAAHDATALAAGSGWRLPILVDQGTADEFLDRELKPELFEAACRTAGIPLRLNRRDGYDHSYYFIASFMADHIAHHAKWLMR